MINKLDLMYKLCNIININNLCKWRIYFFKHELTFYEKVLLNIVIANRIVL